ncbi:MAG: hypothetical protein AABX66_00600 [Nanoarchaeota archaeon]
MPRKFKHSFSSFIHSMVAPQSATCVNIGIAKAKHTNNYFVQMGTSVYGPSLYDETVSTIKKLCCERGLPLLLQGREIKVPNRWGRRVAIKNTTPVCDGAVRDLCEIFECSGIKIVGKNRTTFETVSRDESYESKSSLNDVAKDFAYLSGFSGNYRPNVLSSARSRSSLYRRPLGLSFRRGPGY